MFKKRRSRVPFGLLLQKLDYKINDRITINAITKSAMNIKATQNFLSFSIFIKFPTSINPLFIASRIMQHM